ncbi:hypothetical protein F5Y16DRAFT_195309 [Xylariaceae sp. FL0255]|nr:hypothetical protein F5Y16DRAFT_195309 [Xylariaceae sp. FL0255]
MSSVLFDTMLSALWGIIRWIAFSFKLASLAFIIPTIAMIIFDFGLYVWRLYRPKRRDESSRLPREECLAAEPTPTIASTSATDIKSLNNPRDQSQSQEQAQSGE